MDNNWRLSEALDLRPQGELVALVGGGGKTSLLLALARSIGSRLVLSTTTHLFTYQVEAAGHDLPARVLTLAGPEEIAEAAQKGIVFVIGEKQGTKVGGVSTEEPQKWLALPQVDHVFVEADGARELPIKAPAGHEPALPLGTTLVVPVAGIDAHGQLIERVAHRPQLVAGMLGKSPSDVLSADDMAILLSDPRGGAKRLPDGARLTPVINKVDNVQRLLLGRQIARELLRQPQVHRVVLTTAAHTRPVREVHRRVTAVVLAAGSSRRMGRTKQLLPWKNGTLLSQTLHNARQSGANEVVMVSGHEASAVEAVARAEGVRIVHNPLYDSGEMLSSLQAAVRALHPSTTAILVMLADQPGIGPKIIDRILAAYWQGAGEIIAPSFEGERGNPVLIARPHFDELLRLPQGKAPRDLLARRHVELVDVHTEAILQDIDRPEDYEKLRP